jgi:hypothetical protein
MAIPVRHSGAPLQDGETAVAADLETDIANAYTQMANIENVNVAAAANIQGSKLANTSITGAKLVALTVTQGKIADNAATKHSIDQSSSNAAGTTSWQDRATINFTTGADAAGPVILLAVTQWQYTSGSGGNEANIQFLRDGGAIGIEEKATVRQASADFNQVTNLHVDSGLAAATSYAYKLQFKISAASPVLTLNKSIFLILELRR